MVEILAPGNALVCPNSKGGSVCLDMTHIYATEQRIGEVAFVTPHKAPELLANFNKAFLELTKHITALEYEKVQAERIANKIRATILLDKVPSILEEKGLANARSPAGSEDLRNAILDLDDGYQTARDVVDQIAAMCKLLQGKLKSFEMAYTSVKKIIGENAYNMSNTNLKAGNEEETHGGWYGNAKY